MSHGHLVNQIQHPELTSDNTLHVIGVCSNYVRWHSRYRLARQWIKEMENTPNVKLHLVEMAYGDRKHEITSHIHESHLQLRTKTEIWQKEVMINLGIKHLLPRDWKYVAWVDMDVHFRNPNWALDTIHALQHYNIVQPWSHAADLEFHGGIHSTFTSFGYLCANGKPMSPGKKLHYEYGHTGFAVACTRYWYENVGKIIDFCIVGAGDHHLLWSCVGDIKNTIHTGVTDGYYEACYEFQRKAEYACAGIVGYVPGRLEHQWHGTKEKRGYWSRWDILIKHKFNPKTDVAYDSQGTMVLCGANKYDLEHDIMKYNRSREEDAI